MWSLRYDCDNDIVLVLSYLKTIEENSSVFSLIRMRYEPSVLWHCWLGGRKGIRPVKNMGDGGGGHWLVQMEWRPVRWSVCLPLLIFPCTINSRSSLLAPTHPGGPGKRAVKQLWVCVCVCVCARVLCYLVWRHCCLMFIEVELLTLLHHWSMFSPRTYLWIHCWMWHCLFILSR